MCWKPHQKEMRASPDRFAAAPDSGPCLGSTLAPRNSLISSHLFPSLLTFTMAIPPIGRTVLTARPAQNILVNSSWSRRFL